MKTGTRLLILCLLAPAALAENMSLRSGRVLKDAVVVSSGDDFVNIQYTDGVAKVSYKDLTDAQQRDYRMTPDEVKARLDQRRMEEAARSRPRHPWASSRLFPRRAVHWPIGPFCWCSPWPF